MNSNPPHPLEDGSSIPEMSGLSLQASIVTTPRVGDAPPSSLPSVHGKQTSLHHTKQGKPKATPSNNLRHRVAAQKQIVHSDWSSVGVGFDPLGQGNEEQSFKSNTVGTNNNNTAASNNEGTGKPKVTTGTRVGGQKRKQVPNGMLQHQQLNEQTSQPLKTTTTTNKRSADGMSIDAEEQQVVDGYINAQDQHEQKVHEPESANFQVLSNDDESLSHLLGYPMTDHDNNQFSSSVSSLHGGDPILSLDQISTIYDLEQYLSSLIYREVSFNFLVTPPPMVKPFLWIFLQVRRLAKDLNWLAVALYRDGCLDECTKNLQIGSREVYCGSHAAPKHCKPMEYAWHTLDSASEVLSFASLNLGAGDQHEHAQLISVIPTISHREVTIAYKRMFTIFEHAWYCHRSMFEKFEKVLRLYQRALAVGMYSKMLKTRTPLIPFHRDMGVSTDEEGEGVEGGGNSQGGQASGSVIEGINEYDYMRELDFIIRMTTREKR